MIWKRFCKCFVLMAVVILTLAGVLVLLYGCGHNGGDGEPGPAPLPPVYDFSGLWGGVWTSTMLTGEGGVMADLNQVDRTLDGNAAVIDTFLGDVGLSVLGTVTGDRFSVRADYEGWSYLFKGGSASRAISGTYEIWTSRGDLYDTGTIDLIDSCAGPVPCLAEDWAGLCQQFYDEAGLLYSLYSDGAVWISESNCFDDLGVSYPCEFRGPVVGCHRGELSEIWIDLNWNETIDPGETLGSVSGELRLCEQLGALFELMVDGEPSPDVIAAWIGSCS